MRNKYCYFWVIVAFLTNVSCLNRQFIEGRAELISTSDTMLNDSSMFIGHVTHIDMENLYIPAEIWIENTNYKI